MAVTLHVGDPLEICLNEPHVVNWRVILHYLEDLESFPGIRELAGCNAYGEATFDFETCLKVQEELPRFIHLINSRALHDPTLYYHDYDLWDEFYEDCLSWEALDIFCKDLRVVIDLAVKTNKEIVAVGD